MNKQVMFEPEAVYHVYHHGNGSDSIFRSGDNYHYFLKKYAQYINPVARTYAYCLMPNHFHLMIRIRPAEEVSAHFCILYPEQEKDLRGFENLEGLIMQQFKNFLNGYTKAFNKMYERQGYLFRQNLKRKAVLSEAYFTALIQYIHYNPVHHGFVKSVHEWPHSSYHSLLSNTHTLLAREQVLEWFNGKEALVAFSHQPPDGALFLEMDF